MTFSRVKLLGYAFGEIFPSADVNQLDLDHSLAVDSRGGAYALTDPLSFSGGSFSLAASTAFETAGDVTIQSPGQFTSNGDAFFNNPVVFSDGLNTNYASVNGTLNVAGPAVLADTLFVVSDAAIAGNVQVGTIYVNGTGEFAGGINGPCDFSAGNVRMFTSLSTVGSATFTANGPSAFYSLATFAAGATLVGTITVSGIVSYASTGRELERCVVGTDADGVTYSPTTNRHVYFPLGGLTATRTVLVSDSGVDGDWIQFECADTTYQANITIPGPTVCSIGAALDKKWVKARRVAGTWRFVASGTMPV